jgi:hypothetical protein
VKVDATALFDALDEIESFVKGEWQVKAAEILNEEIKSDSESGVDADGVKFPDNRPGHPYSLSQEVKRLSKSKSIILKDLKITGGLLKSGTLVNNGLEPTGTDSKGTDYERIAHGQMKHPKWRYHHKFFAASDKAITKIAEAVQTLFSRRFSK